MALFYYNTCLIDNYLIIHLPTSPATHKTGSGMVCDLLNLASLVYGSTQHICRATGPLDLEQIWCENGQEQTPSEKVAAGWVAS